MTTRMSLPGKQSLSEDESEKKPRKKSRKKPSPRKPVGSRFGLPIKEAKENLWIPLLQVDVDAADADRPKNVNDEKNFLSCVIAKAVTRAAGAEHVAIQRGVAYVAYPGDNCTRRYMLSQKARNTMETWDRGEPVQTEVGLGLRAPRKFETAAAKRKAVREFTERHPEYRGAKRRNGTTTGRKQRGSDPLNGIVRHGNLVRFS